MGLLSVQNYKHHPYHILSNASVPFWLSCSLFILAAGLILFFHTSKSILLLVGLVLTVISIWKWSSEILEESKNSYIHNKEIEEQFLFGGFLFIVSETMLFFGFFWAFFHTSLNPSIFIGGIFPPAGIESLNPAHWPLINTLTLLLSGGFVNVFYYTLKKISPSGSYFILRNLKNQSERKLPYVLSGYRKTNDRTNLGVYRSTINAISILFEEFSNLHGYLILTITLGIIFLGFQFHEYINHASFEISDGIYGSVFYMLTGLHGFHVLAGVAFLFYNLVQFHLGYFRDFEPHVGVTFSVLYFHYVDVVWLFLYIFVYLWGC